MSSCAYELHPTPWWTVRGLVTNSCKKHKKAREHEDWFALYYTGSENQAKVALAAALDDPATERYEDLRVFAPTKEHGERTRRARPKPAPPAKPEPKPQEARREVAKPEGSAKPRKRRRKRSAAR